MLTWTICPPNRVCAAMALSTLTLSPTFSWPAIPIFMPINTSFLYSCLPDHKSENPPRFVRFRVSGANPTLNVSSSNSVTVKQAPFTQIESPI
jgi:hypothetical protein